MADQFPQAGSKSQDVRAESGAGGPGQGATHGATATAVATSRGTHERGRTLAGALIGALGVTVVSAIFGIGALLAFAAAVMSAAATRWVGGLGLLVLSAWALAGVIALVLAAILHPPSRQPGQRPESSQRASVAPTSSAARAA